MTSAWRGWRFSLPFSLRGLGALATKLAGVEPFLVNLQSLDPRLERRRRHANSGRSAGRAGYPALARGQGRLDDSLLRPHQSFGKGT
jgi:hypothetical protein